VKAKAIKQWCAGLACVAAMLPMRTVQADQTLVQASKDPEQWLMPGKDYGATRFSALDQIDARNVGNLQMAWVFSTGVLNGHESAPLVVGDTLYVVTPYPNILHAIDLTKPGGDLKWSYTPNPMAAAQGVACCDVVNRGAAYAEGRIFFNTLDNHTVAVDAKSGKEIWKTKLGEIDDGETMTMAPLVVKGKVLVGNSGGEMGVRGKLSALDAGSGKVVWTAYSTGPDKDVLIGDGFKAPYADGNEPDLGVTTWPENAWKTGGGAVWGWVTYDPELDLIFYGTSNPAPWNHAQRPGDNKWTASIFARDPDTGMAKWAYQWNPHDVYDHDGVNESLVLNLKIDGKQRQVLAHAARNGYMYVMDRTNGRIISYEPYVPVNAFTGVDMKTGRPIPNEAKVPEPGKVTENICPAAPGGKDWQPMAFSPRTQWLYVPHNNLCMDFKPVQTNYIRGTPFVGAEVAMTAGPGGHRGFFTAWDPVKNQKVWQIEEKFPVWSGALVTAGDVVFYGTLDRWFKAVDAKSGKELWRFRTGSGIIGQPITFSGPDGRQYVAVLAGVGGWAGAVVAGNLDTRVPYGALGFVGATTDLPQYTTEGGALYVFALPQSRTQSADAQAQDAQAEAESDARAGQQQ